MLSQRESNDMSSTKNPSLPNKNYSSDEDSAPLKRNKKRTQRFSDSDTENENELSNVKTDQNDSIQNNSDSEPETRFPVKMGLTKSRIHMESSSSDSDDAERYKTVKNEEQQIRMMNKRNKLKDKFKGLLSHRVKHTLQTNSDKQSLEDSHGEVFDPSDTEMSSIAKIKQKIKKSMASTMSSICDPDTSDEESHMNKKQIPKQRHRNQPKTTKLIEPKPIRMSAKQAMENMQLIKSESNRMLREKAVSLPYHRPKALSLKDIMSRRKPAVSSDGKALPIKMNEEQLKQYVLSLEQRQKEMMELCKSESDEETNETEEKDDGTCPESEKLPDSNNIENDNNIMEKSSNTIECVQNETNIATNMDDANDVMYNELIKNNTVNTNSTEVENTNCDGDNIEEEIPLPNIDSNNQPEDDKNNSNTDFKLVYNDSVEEENGTAVNTGVPKEDGIQNEISENNEHFERNSEQPVSKLSSEPESQLISLHYTENNTEELEKSENANDSPNESSEKMDIPEAVQQDDLFSDDDVNMDDIDRIIENAEIMKDDDSINSPMLIRDLQAPNANPKIMGAPGMVIDLDGGVCVPKKLSGVELLKERFNYFSKLKTPEELERDKEKTLKPGAQHQKLKHELEEKIAEQRSLEWAKRLEEEKQQHMEMETILDDAEDSLEKIEAKLDETGEKEQENSSESEEEEELDENDVEIKDKPRKNNPMLDNEAEESDCDENDADIEPTDHEHKEDIDGDDKGEEEDDEGDESSEEDESSESEEEESTKTKKSRILKAFEDSDDEDNTVKQNETDTAAKDKEINDVDVVLSSNEVPGSSQDDVIQLAQRFKSASEDLFTSQESSVVNDRNKDGNSATDEVFGTQSFSILESTAANNLDIEIKSPSKISALCMSQPYHDPNLNAIVDGSQLPITQSSQSQPIGEDILALCTGKFYDNEFVSQTEEYQHVDGISQDQESLISSGLIEKQDELVADDKLSIAEENIDTIDKKIDDNNKKSSEDGNVLKFILDELDDPEFDKPKPNKFFTGGNTQKKEIQLPENSQMKKKFIIDSDDDTNETNVEANQGKRKKLKKKRPEKRALQISDDEEEEDQLEQEEDEYMSDLEDAEILVEYDSEENEIEVKPDKPKKKRKATEFFEQEAELTSEDEWVGSGDEDEKGLDRMEREAGDDEVFHQGKLRRELGQIHMRDVLDQDKREVRIIQELLFEDGDLGDGHRQRKFRWRNAGEEDETGTAVGEFADTQEEEFESEEQWRKQRHEREVFLRQMQQNEEEGLNVSVNRTTIIKANLSSKSMSTLLQEVNQSKADKTESLIVQEKKTVKDIPSPKKSFSIFQQNCHGSLLTRGRGALARLAALATPLAADDDAPKIGSLASHKRNFVFTALTPDDDEPKVTIKKRKADISSRTPKLVKKMKIEENTVHPKSSLLDHFNL